MFAPHPFDRDRHVFHSPELKDLLLNAVRFFNGTPVYPLDKGRPVFTGSGIYALYYTGPMPLYAPVAAANRTSYQVPIYVGKAIPAGGRRGVLASAEDESSLHRRLREHAKSIQQTATGSAPVATDDFTCRFVLIPGAEAALIAPIEAALIRQYLPIWNAVVDGFGNHAPGKGRYEQARSAWDVLHPGRPWADRCQGVAPQATGLAKAIEAHFATLSSIS